MEVASAVPECDHVESVESDEPVDEQGIAAGRVAKRPVVVYTVTYPARVLAKQAVLETAVAVQIHSSAVQVFDQAHTVLTGRLHQEKQFAEALAILECSDTERQAATRDLVERLPVREHRFVPLAAQDEVE